MTSIYDDAITGFLLPVLMIGIKRYNELSGGSNVGHKGGPVEYTGRNF